MDKNIFRGIFIKCCDKSIKLTYLIWYIKMIAHQSLKLLAYTQAKWACETRGGLGPKCLHGNSFNKTSETLKKEPRIAAIAALWHRRRFFSSRVDSLEQQMFYFK
jgi:hypothetical protein